MRQASGKHDAVPSKRESAKFQSRDNSLGIRFPDWNDRALASRFGDSTVIGWLGFFRHFLYLSLIWRPCTVSSSSLCTSQFLTPVNMVVTQVNSGQSL